MDNKLILTEENRSIGTYKRRTYKKDTIYTFFAYKDVLAVYNMRAQTVNITDSLAERLLQEKYITAAVKQQYDCRLHELFEPIEQHDDRFIEEIYKQVCRLRREVLGSTVLQREEAARAAAGCNLDPTGGIDQRRKKDELLHENELILFICTQPELCQQFVADIKTAKALGKMVGIYPYWEANWQQLVNDKKACLLFYGEEGLLHCRGLKVEAIVHGTPSWYHTRALTNQFGVDKDCVVYIPAGFDITQWVPLIERSRLTYWHLARLWEKYGDEIYTWSPQELYQRYPQYFINIYENGAECPEADEKYPIRIEWHAKENQKIFETYDCLREQAVSNYLNCHEQLEYYSAYFDEFLNKQEIDWNSDTPQPGTMVQAVKVGKVNGARVIDCESYPTVRKMAEDTAWNDKNVRLRLFSNFLFFLTPKLARMYNELRADRPAEQIVFDKMHLDYMLYEKEGKRIETFPLFQKSCIAMKEDGHFLFFNFELGGGKISVGEFSAEWRKEDINAEGDGPIHIYTPYASAADGEADAKTYRKPVGEGRINIVIVQEQIICVREGDVILPSIGVMVSLSQEMGREFLHKNGLASMDNGYFDCSNLELNIELEPPSGILKEEWKQVKWAYGGGMSLILDGKGLLDEEKEDHMLALLAKEGWMSPLSRQTQESALHDLVKHPRTAIGITENDELVIIVYSGRTRMSTGADYREMIMIARELFPTIKNLMNVDGGGSAMLGMAIDGNFMELSYPATSIDSCAGMVRPVNTVLCLDIE